MTPHPARRLRPHRALVLAIVTLVAVSACAPPMPPGPHVSQPDAVASPPAAATPVAVATPTAGGESAAVAVSIAAETGPTAATCPAMKAGSAPPPVRTRSAEPPRIGALAAVVIDAGSGAVLWGKDEHLALQPASTTKIVTALLAVEHGRLDEVVPVQVEQRLLSRGTQMGLITGDAFTLRDLLFGLMLPSGNDAAIAIATHLAGSEPAFARAMNARLCELGLTDSTFVNASGLGRTEFNMASAHDLAQVARIGMQYPEFAELARVRAYTARGSRTLSFSNLNELLAWYRGADGVKIGWTPGAGSTIVASATRNGRQVIVALLKTPNRSAESAALLDWAFASHGWQDGGR
jgi:serine-type D-Ala-D-Ala carboxypeptidase (penicillin-binding protein 5/6)